MKTLLFCAITLASCDPIPRPRSPDYSVEIKKLYRETAETYFAAGREATISAYVQNPQIVTNPEDWRKQAKIVWKNLATNDLWMTP